MCRSVPVSRLPAFPAKHGQNNATLNPAIMSNTKQTIIAAAVAVTFTTTAQADGLSDSLPLGKSLAAGHELPLSLGVSANVFFLEQNMEAQSISIDIPPLPLPTGLVELPPARAEEQQWPRWSRSLHGIEDRLGFHHHAHTTTERAVVDRAMDV